MCFGFLLHKQSCKWDLYKFVLISWPGAASRYLLHRRILIAASRVGRSLGSQCTEDEMQQAAVAWRGASSAEPPPALRYGGLDFGTRSQRDICSQNYTLIVSQRSQRHSRVLTALVSSSSAVIIAPGGVLKNGWEKKRDWTMKRFSYGAQKLTKRDKTEILNSCSLPVLPCDRSLRKS